MAKIGQISSEEILDSRGTPTLKTTVYLDDGSVGSASAPSGASVGTHEAVELRDGDPFRYNGKGVLKAIENVQGLIFQAIKGLDSSNQQKIDQIMRDLDGTENKSRLGANAILSVSLAVAAAASRKIPLYQYLRGLVSLPTDKDFRIPAPMANLIEGGKHFGQGLAFQEFLVIPKGLSSAAEGLEGIKKVIGCLEKLIGQGDLSHQLGMEGGFSPKLQNNEQAVVLLKKAIADAGFSEKNWAVGLDLAATSFYRDGRYQIGNSRGPLDRGEFIEFLEKLCKKHSLFSLEDALEENDWDGWKELTKKLSKDVMIIGDDLTTTNLRSLETVVEEKAATGVIVKPNQIGTLTETLGFVKRAREAGLKIIISHRGGETSDTFIADLAVAASADFIKIGSPLKKERLAKYQRLIEIDEGLEK